MHRSTVKPIAFYLPQFHPVRENSEWWGPGFTEWTNVARAVPNYQGHYQPHVPRDLGFYDLRIIDNMRAQAELAREHGIHGFCFYHYWFNGRRILELPVNQFLASDIDMPFCLCWANENWTRTWDGLEKSVLLGQAHSPEDDLAFIKAILPALGDPRYIRVDGKPMLLVYRADLFPDSRRTAEIWRNAATAAGLPGLHLCAVQFYGIDDPQVYGFDAAVEFPPHNYIGPQNRLDYKPAGLHAEFRGALVDYRKVVAQSMKRTAPDYPLYRGIVPSWDNTARRQFTSHILVGSSPRLYEFWLSYLLRYTEHHLEASRRFVFINAWNEWAEGAHLEPDLRHGRAYLEATLGALNHRKLDILGLFGNEHLTAVLGEHLDAADRESLTAAFSAHMLTPGTPPDAQGPSDKRLRDRLHDFSPSLYRVARSVYRAFR